MPATPQQLEDRWKTPDGQERLSEVVKAIQNGREDWEEVLPGFPFVEEVKNGRDLRCANLSGADLNGADLRVTNLSGAILSGTNLSGANLSGAILSEAILIGTTLIGAILREANLSGAN